MASFIINTKAELWKCRKTAAYFIALAAGAFVPFINLLTYLFKSTFFVKVMAEDPWHTTMNQAWQPAAAFMMPMFVILLTSLVVQVEYRNNTWKQVYASPRSYADIFFSKFLIVHLLIIFSLVLFNLFMVLFGYVANMVHSGYTFFSHAVPWGDMLRLTAKMYVSILAMTAIQYWLSLRLKNYIAPLGIGITLLITGLIIMKWEHIKFYPYAYTALTYFKDLGKGDQTHQYYSYIWFVGIVLLSFWDTVRRKERG